MGSCLGRRLDTSRQTGKGLSFTCHWLISWLYQSHRLRLGGRAALVACSYKISQLLQRLVALSISCIVRCG